MITTEADWADIDSSAYRVFCVHAGDYRSLGSIWLTASGTASQPRILRYFDPNAPQDQTHPVHQAETARALVQHLVLKYADHWVISGIAVSNNDPDMTLANYGVTVQHGAEHNVLHRLLVEGGRGGVIIRNQSHYNVLQQSVVRETIMTPADSNCINLHAGTPTQLRGNRIVSNESYNCTTSLQLVVVDASAGSSFPGTIVANNDFYLTPERYSDCKGNLDPNGACACAEARFDIKAGGTSATLAGRVTVVRNRIWGARKTDSACGGGGSWGGGIGLCCGHNHPIKYVLLEDNIVFDVARGIGTSDGDLVSVRNNLLYDIYSPFDGQGLGIMVHGDRVEVYGNTVVSAVRWGQFRRHIADVRCNTIIDGGSSFSDGTEVVADFNAYYNAAQLAKPGSNDIVEGNATDARQQEKCFWRRLVTGPEQVCIPHAIATVDSPHRDHCDPNLGSRIGVGIDDEPIATTTRPAPPSILTVSPH